MLNRLFPTSTNPSTSSLLHIQTSYAHLATERVVAQEIRPKLHAACWCRQLNRGVSSTGKAQVALVERDGATGVHRRQGDGHGISGEICTEWWPGRGVEGECCAGAAAAAGAEEEAGAGDGGLRAGGGQEGGEGEDFELHVGGR